VIRRCQGKIEINGGKKNRRVHNKIKVLMNDKTTYIPKYKFQNNNMKIKTEKKKKIETTVIRRHTQSLNIKVENESIK
jgi:hypothetical protein